ncbi:MAG: hypothetical protein ABI318_03795 [Chthoniobacteraceae bacterium]
MRSHLTLLTFVLISLTAFAEDKQATITAGDAPALSLTVPKEAKVTKKGDMTKIEAKHLWIYLWHVPNAKTVADAVPRVATIIKSEFTDFTLTDSKNLKVAGNEAKHLFGKGAEADDGDPGTAEVVIFTDGKHVFAACVHGERDEAAKERPDLLNILKTVKVL